MSSREQMVLVTDHGSARFYLSRTMGATDELPRAVLLGYHAVERSLRFVRQSPELRGFAWRAMEFLEAQREAIARATR